MPPDSASSQASGLPISPVAGDALHRLRDLALSESGFVFDPFSGATFSVNGTGKAVLEALRDGVAPEAIPALLGERFAPAGGAATHAAPDLSRDVADFIAQLRRLELLPAPEPA